MACRSRDKLVSGALENENRQARAAGMQAKKNARANGPSVRFAFSSLAACQSIIDD
jgi:hypothetical protein